MKKKSELDGCPSPLAPKPSPLAPPHRTWQLARAYGSLLVALLSIALGETSSAQGPENTAIVVNADSWASTYIANEYVSARRIPPQNVVYVAGLPSFEQISVDDFRQLILLPVLKTIESRGLAGQIDCLLYSADLPTSVALKADLGDRQLPQVFTPQGSINGLTFLYQFVLARDIRYLDMNANFYARRPLQGAVDPTWTDDERQQYAKVQAQWQEATRRGRPRTAKAKDQPDKPAADGDDADAKQKIEAALREALEVMQQLRTKHPKSADLLYNLACAHALLGSADEAMDALTQAVDAGWWNHQHTERDEDLKPLRQNPTYKALIARMKEMRFDVQPTTGFSASVGWLPDGTAAELGVRYLLSTVLACTSGRANSVRESIAALRRSIAADGTRPTGTVYFLQNGDIRSTTREWAFASAAERLGDLGVRASIERGVLPTKKPDVAGAVIGSASFDWNQCGSSILPGAICEHLTSFGGAMAEGAGQTPLSEFIRHGAAGASGTVTEPYAIQAKFPNAFLHLHYARGCSLAEAFYQSVTGPYQLLIVGDALCRPWAQRLKVRAAGIDAEKPLTGKVDIKPTVETPPGVAVDSLELFVDGRRVKTVPAGADLQLDTAQVADGSHELTVVAHGNDPVRSAGRLALPVQVRNGKNQLTVAPLPSREIPWNRPLEIAASLPEATKIVFWHNARPVATIEGSEGRATIDPRVLGQGPVRLLPVGTVPGQADQPVQGRPIEFTVVPPEPLAAADNFKEADLAAGFRLVVEDKPNHLVTRAEGDWLAKAGVAATIGFTVDALFCVPERDVYQFQLRGNVRVQSLVVDGQVQDWPRGGDWWTLPVHLEPGLHRLHIQGEGADRPTLDIRFGGPGTQRLDGARFKHIKD